MRLCGWLLVVGVSMMSRAAVAQDSPPPAEVQPPPEKPAAKPNFAETAKLGTLLQGWFIADRTGDETATTFRMRRAEISLKGELLPKQVAYALMIDAAKVLETREVEVSVDSELDPDATVTVRQPAGAISVFQDAFITYMTSVADVSLGQFKIPVSWEGFNSSSKLLFAERAAVSREFGDRRDLGLRIGKAFDRFGYWVALHNGSGLNTLDNNKAKDGAVRLEAYPIDGLTVGGVAYATLWARNDPAAKDRYEIDLRYEHGPFLFQSEAIRSRDIASDRRSTHGQGFYAAVAFKVMDTLQPAVRVGYLDPNRRRNLDPEGGGKDELWHFDAGLNYFLSGHNAKLQLNYFRSEFDEKVASNQVVLAAQISF